MDFTFSNDMVYVVSVDGATGTVVHSGKPGAETEHEACCSAADDVGNDDTSVGCSWWFCGLKFLS